MGVIKKIRSAESTISMILGIVVVVVVGILLFNYFKSTPLTTKTTEEEIKEGGEEKQETVSGERGVVPANLPQKYSVQSGDNLWKISLKFFGSGYNWVDIRQENRIENPNVIFVGQELNIPNVSVRRPLLSSASQAQPITGDSYTVTRGDNLWNISVRAYQDGFKWPELAKANHLTDPQIIHPGNVLVIPR